MFALPEVYNLTISYLSDKLNILKSSDDSAVKKSVSREISYDSGKGTVSREPSFIYDTSVEAFGSEGGYTVLELEDGPEQKKISIIGRIAGEIDIDPVDPFQAGVDSLYLGGDFDMNEEDKEASSTELPNCVQVSFDAFNSPDLRIPLTGLDWRGPGIAQPVNPEDRSMSISVPEAELKRLSSISFEGGSKISSTPEGESYFMAREESFIKKVYDGELQNLAVEVSDYFSVDAVKEDLLVKPISKDPKAEIEIKDLRLQSCLRVKSEARAPVSSFETIYDKISLEDIGSTSKLTKEEILASLGDKFQGTMEVPEFVSSFDELCQFSAMDMDQSIRGASGLDPALDCGRRWTAPAGSVEAPILEAEEFSVRFEPVVERTEGHWEELEKMMEGKSGRQQG